MVFRKLFGSKQDITPPTDNDVLLQGRDAYLAFRFADMQALYASREHPEQQAFEIRRSKDDGWLLRLEQGNHWDSLANRYPDWAERVPEIDKAFEKFLMSILIDEEGKVQ